MTECNQTAFAFEVHFSRQVVAGFDGAQMTTDGGALLLRAVDRKIGLLKRVAACFTDGRDPERVEHSLGELLRQRIGALALGYEDLNDHEELRHDPLLGLLAGKRELGEPLAGKSTLNRLELTPALLRSERYHKIRYSAEALDELLVNIFLEAHPRWPHQIVLDLDVTDMPLHGEQEARFFHGYYGHYCYLPLYIFCEDHLLCARLRPSNQDASAGSVAEVERIVRQIRRRWPHVRIILRADSGFCREELMAWCEKTTAWTMCWASRATSGCGGKLRHRCVRPGRSIGARQKRPRVFAEFSYRTRSSWSRARRVVAKAEYLEKGENPRYLVTSLKGQVWSAQQLYERLYCARGEMENRIKEQLSLFSDRLSSETLRANQLRLYFSSLAYVLMHALRRLGLAGTEWATAQVETIRLRLLKIAAEVLLSARRIWVRYSRAYPWKTIFAAAYAALSG